MESKVYAVILAAGVGTRFGNDRPKQLMVIEGQTVLEHSIGSFDSVGRVDEIILVIHERIQQSVNSILSRALFKKPIRLVLGGRTRLESSRKAIKHVRDNDKVLIHDAVRPFLSGQLIERCLDALEEHDSVYPVVPATNTIVQSLDGVFVSEVPVRNQLLIGQTPQGFKGWALRAAHKKAAREADETLAAITNDCALVHKYRVCPIRMIEGERQNVKITYPEDELLAQQYFRLRFELTQPEVSRFLTPVSLSVGKVGTAYVEKEDR